MPFWIGLELVSSLTLVIFNYKETALLWLELAPIAAVGFLLPAMDMHIAKEKEVKVKIWDSDFQIC